MIKIWAVNIAFKKLMVGEHSHPREPLFHCFWAQPLAYNATQPIPLGLLSRRLLLCVFKPGKSFNEHLSLSHDSSHDRFAVLGDPILGGFGPRLSRVAPKWPWRILWFVLIEFSCVGIITGRDLRSSCGSNSGVFDHGTRAARRLEARRTAPLLKIIPERHSLVT